MALGKLKDKALGLVKQHGDKIDSGLEKAGRMVDKKTGGKYHKKIVGGVDKAQEALERTRRKENETDSAGVQDLEGLDHGGSTRVADEGLGARDVSRESPKRT